MLRIIKYLLRHLWGKQTQLEGGEFLKHSRVPKVRYLYVSNHRSWKDVAVILGCFIHAGIELPLIISSPHLNWFPLSWLLSLLGCRFLEEPKKWMLQFNQTQKLFAKFQDSEKDLLIFIDGKRTETEYLYPPKCWGLKNLSEQCFSFNAPIPSEPNFQCIPICVELANYRHPESQRLNHWFHIKKTLHRLAVGHPINYFSLSHAQGWKKHLESAQQLKIQIQRLHHWTVPIQALCALWMLKEARIISTPIASPSALYVQIYPLTKIFTFLTRQLSVQNAHPPRNQLERAIEALYYSPPKQSLLRWAMRESLPYLNEVALYIQMFQKRRTFQEPLTAFSLEAAHFWGEFYSLRCFQRPPLNLLKKLTPTQLDHCLQPSHITFLSTAFLPLWKTALLLEEGQNQNESIFQSHESEELKQLYAPLKTALHAQFLKPQRTKLEIPSVYFSFLKQLIS